jgi:maltooligosyltrehalose trehalohydrolase
MRRAFPESTLAEDDRNLARLAMPVDAGGFGLDALWADDFHHHMRRRLAGDREGYFESYEGGAADIALTLQSGWFYRGQVAPTPARLAAVPRNRSTSNSSSSVFRITTRSATGRMAIG